MVACRDTHSLGRVCNADLRPGVLVSDLLAGHGPNLTPGYEDRFDADPHDWPFLGEETDR